MKNIPLIFTPALAHLTWFRVKTQTRRVVGLDRINANPDHWELHGQNVYGEYLFYSTCEEPEECPPAGKYKVVEDHCPGVVHIKCRYGTINDRLYVREKWRTMASYDGVKPVDLPRTAPIEFMSRNPAQYGGKNRSALHLPRWAARSILMILEIRLERVQAITTADAVAEGIPATYEEAVQMWGEKALEGRRGHIWDNHTTKENYQWLWDQINLKSGFGWNVNPWVWVVDYRRIEGGKL